MAVNQLKPDQEAENTQLILMAIRPTLKINKKYLFLKIDIQLCLKPFEGTQRTTNKNKTGESILRKNKLVHANQ